MTLAIGADRDTRNPVKNLEGSIATLAYPQFTTHLVVKEHPHGTSCASILAVLTRIELATVTQTTCCSPLSFRTKLAGEVRVELTFRGSKPRPFPQWGTRLQTKNFGWQHKNRTCLLLINSELHYLDANCHQNFLDCKNQKTRLVSGLVVNILKPPLN